MTSQVLSSAELERMRNSVLPAEVNDLKGRRRAELKKLSQDRLQHWPNTLEAARLKKESYLAEKAQREEEARQEVDKIVRCHINMRAHGIGDQRVSVKILQSPFSTHTPSPPHPTYRRRNTAAFSVSKPSSAPTTSCMRRRIR